MEKEGESSSKGKKLSPEEELKYFKNVVKCLMKDASKILAEMELLSHGAETEEKISLLNHYLDYAKRLCECNKELCESDKEDNGVVLPFLDKRSHEKQIDYIT